MNEMNVKLPEGFEKRPQTGAQFKEQKDNGHGGPGFGPGGRRGGPPGMGEVEKPKETKKTLSRLVRYFAAEKKLLILLVISVGAVTLTSLAAPSIQGDAIDAITNGEFSQLYILLGLLLGAYLIGTLFTLFQTLLSANLSQRIVKKMRGDLFEKIVRLPIKYIDTHSNGDIMSRMTNDVENISNTVSQSLGSLVSGVLTVVGTVVIMFIKCWQLTLITLLTVVATFVVTKYLSGFMRKIYKKRSVALGRLNGHSEEMITGYRTVVAYNEQNNVKGEFDKASDELADVSTRAEILGGSMGPIMNCISNVGFVIVAAFGGWFALMPSIGITIGTISAFIIYAKQFSRPINEIAQLYGSLQTAIAGAERVFELMDQPDEEDTGELEAGNVKGEVSFRNVNFSYLPDKQVLHDFSLEVSPGQKIALVGATGSGKTTVVNLLMRFYEPDSGQILIDGVDIRDMKRDALRKTAAIVLQDTVLFSDTVENNIKYADFEASEEAMEQAAQMSNASYFVDRLPSQYQTYLSHAGANLSQGQRQLIAIARVVLADPRILILDEATSSVDTRTEKNIQDAMTNLMKNRTSLIIAHRLSTVRDADRIVVMDGGRIVETGNHEQLLAQKGRYYELYMTQFAGNQI